MKRLQAKVKIEDAGMRLDLFWVKVAPELSRRKIRQIIDVGGAYQNRKRVRMASRQVQAGDALLLEYNDSALADLKAKQVELAVTDIIYEDPQIIAINKPAQMPSQPTRSQTIFHVEAALKQLLESQGKKPRKLMVCHRLDKETTGVLVVGRTKPAVEFVMAQFREKTTKKVYWAICRGLTPKSPWKIDNHLSDIDPKSGMVRSVRSGGRAAVTRFKTLFANTDENVSLVECYPETGRSHQIRVHLAEAGFPILGDKKYGASLGGKLSPKITELAAQHHMLHARSLTLKVPADGSMLRLVAEVPNDFLTIAKSLGAFLGD
jgi:23S rRNA pseudouridine1911/1915/1917 synthase